MTVVEYGKRFTAKYALAFVIDEVGKCKQFKERLWNEMSWGHKRTKMMWLDDV